MENIRRILFPIDLSEVSHKLAPSAVAMARKFDAELHVLFVSRAFDELPDFMPSVRVVDLVESMQKAGETKLEEFEQNHCRGCGNVKRVVLRGDPVEEILKYIKTADIDLVVMGTHGRKGLDRIQFGSVAERVLRESPVPVLTVNPYRSKAS